MWRPCSTGGGSCRSSRSSNFNLRSFGERVALNMPIQGTAADIMKLAMVARGTAAEGRSCRRQSWFCRYTTS